MADIIIKNAYVLTMDPDAGDIKKGTVVIEDGKITEMGEKTKESADTVIDAKGSVVMPGLVNTHTHAAMTLFRGYADDLQLAEWLEKHIWPAEAQLTAEDVYRGSLLACLEMIRSGTTSFADMYFFMDETAKAVEASGLRASLSHGLIELWNEEKGENDLKEGKRFVRAWQGAAKGRIKTMYGPHAPNTCSDEFLAKVKEAARQDGAGLHIHVLETEAELLAMKERYGKCSVHMLDDIGFFGPDVLAAHCVWLSDGDIEVLREKGVNVSHNPISNMKLASGTAPVYKMLERGVNVSLGTDGCASNNNLDLFEEMKTAALLHKLSTCNPTALPARQVLQMATVNGAKALGTETGMLKAGMKADMIIVDMKKPHLTPCFDVPSHLVYSAGGSDVRTTIVDGKILMQDYRVMVLDEPKVIEEAQKAAEELVARVNS
ncbi:amidohydrolase family protein [Methanosarcina mazei]|uniref:5'-deoxyadenosine deaminase n=4 Tax=Methanosarcina mazei TaxID=2209 RepID=A0A0F8IS48_METMZ|nr:amidohydrolase family protein [Methanosarcina mazei]AGF97650.1 S-adenosylhomocysteine deaminase/Methylthioadenosine deaminase [Methanosarcina mazei Tuc01]AKB40947.1 S-adenosylhomocysteine deaminase [Methanosarcina mazei WWM610]AKB62279.1 S-adenosylhomocysteine deaminase [Methanosarcina mazei SarPi]KKG64571.1 N-ethylammeline chlorohydrolase [Methanosarcina mazei]KKG71351.1 N-ethylammeline chlorohydrolase [Methanosarcina mazei]